ncbi:Methylthioribose-1-phosphate isomerase [Botrimarina colliarenosi]|uniref:Methylthioribose-1-phosphate isomerase n=1 Tax=Botrimarina colliarenosi TaxID=2528001 RepID=A0A5C6AIV4_9BACT|nr:S-methyl-5-thioribose-1-phosphate isomerase [Botrimarina colliarenosi]TWT99944.1 Methylthioribose-1-phosphate isomerase [Botrimarina colliarenosi]
MNRNNSDGFETLSWTGAGDGFLTLLDQTRLPNEVTFVNCDSVEDVWQAIKRLAVRGAPAIGIAAAYGVVLGARDEKMLGSGDSPKTAEQGCRAALAACDHLATSRPTAVNLFWALDRMRGVIATVGEEPSAGRVAERLLAEAVAIHEADRAQCAAIGRYGADLLETLGPTMGIVTHCNTGMLATGGDGTALAVLFALNERGMQPHVYADETRPLLQGARLTAWELMERGVHVTLICDSMAAPLLRDGKAQAVIVGADRITARGDTANKIGTYGLAVQAKHHGVPFYVAAPTTTFDLSITSGDEIPIEQRAPEEITEAFGRRTAPEGVEVDNPAFDVTPAELITAIITERGVIEPVSEEAVRAMVDPESTQS